MKFIVNLIIIGIILTSCDNKTITTSDIVRIKLPKKSIEIEDSISIIYYLNNIYHPIVFSKSDRQIDLLYNNINNYIGKPKNEKVYFQTECLSCEPLQKFEDGLLFAKQLLITSDKIKYFKKSKDIPDSLNRVKLKSINREKIVSKFKFSNGKGSIRYLDNSCIDADFNRVTLSYPSGFVSVDSLINASFFEYDLNGDGEIEQYLIGSRSCNQDLIILRIQKSKHTKLLKLN